MEVHYYKTYSEHLQREVEYKTYGHEGRGVLVFPSQDQRFYEWEDNGMIEVLTPMIEAGLFHLICCDSIDQETWSVPLANPDQYNDYNALANLHERWFLYITEELIPTINHGEKLMVTGCSMGGYHAGNAFFRRPDLFDTLLSLSGLFHADYFFPGFDESDTNSLLFRNSPLHFLPLQNNPNLLNEQYRHKQIILCCGQGDYEQITCASTQRLGQLLAEKNIPATVDIWGYDVNHNFDWWRKQALYFFSQIFDHQLRIVA